jgi:dTDP-alpha-D-glucuronic acid decarboxylase
MARVLVTGGSGFVGSHLAEFLAEAGDDVTVFDVAPPRLEQAASLRFIQGDVRDEDAVAKAFAHGFDTVYHLSAVVGVDRYLAVPVDVVEINMLGTLNLLRLAHVAGAKIVLASTSEVYGRNPATPWHEDADRVLGSTAVDRWSYSTSKALAEHLTFAYIRQHQLRAAIVRYFNVYGPRQRPAYVVSKSVHRALRGLAPEVYDGGSQTRCFTYVRDAVRGTVLAGTKPESEGECFNIGSDRESTVADVVGMICQLAGVPEVPAATDTADRFGATYQDITRRVPDTSKAREVLGFRATTALQEGLRKTIDWARANPWWLAS